MADLTSARTAFARRDWQAAHDAFTAAGAELEADDLDALAEASHWLGRPDEAITAHEQAGGRAQWQHSYVTDDKLFCVYVAEDADAVYEHAKCGGFPADAVLQVGTIIDRTTGE